MVAVKKSSQPGLYANIHAKQKRIAHGSGEAMKKPGSPDAPSDAAFDAAAGRRAGGKGAEPAAAKRAGKTGKR